MPSSSSLLTSIEVDTPGATSSTRPNTYHSYFSLKISPSTMQVKPTIIGFYSNANEPNLDCCFGPFIILTFLSFSHWIIIWWFFTRQIVKRQKPDPEVAGCRPDVLYSRLQGSLNVCLSNFPNGNATFAFQKNPWDIMAGWCTVSVRALIIRTKRKGSIFGQSQMVQYPNLFDNARHMTEHVNLRARPVESKT